MDNTELKLQFEYYQKERGKDIEANRPTDYWDKEIANLEAEVKEIGNGWHSVEKFLRPIKTEDFDNYPEYNLKEIMSGFYGEYWGLSDKDPEQRSYEMSAMLKKMLKGAVGEENKAKIVFNTPNQEKEITPKPAARFDLSLDDLGTSDTESPSLPKPMTADELRSTIERGRKMKIKMLEDYEQK